MNLTIASRITLVVALSFLAITFAACGTPGVGTASNVGNVRDIRKEIQNQADKDMKDIKVKVAIDAEEQYKRAAKSGTETDAYVHAGMAAAAWNQAGDDERYARWKEIERAHAKRLGLPVK